MIDEIFGEDGLLAQAIDGFKPRAIQRTMAAAVSAAIENDETLVVEAGTGIGKTFAYLVPALLSNKKIIISTGTKHLQEQLFYRDLPLICRAFHSPLKIALLKGRANYLCAHHLELNYRQTSFNTELRQIKNWAEHSYTGDIAELTQIPEDSSVWHQVTSTVDNCLGLECPQIGDCFLVKARRLALEADILVINHHLFFADAVLRDTGFGELLPGSQAIIFDEAHQLPEVASDFFGEVLTSRQFLELIRDILSEQSAHALDVVQLKEKALQLEQSLQNLRIALGRDDQKALWANIFHKPQLQTALTNLKNDLADVYKILEILSLRSKGLTNCHERIEKLMIKLEVLNQYQSDDKVHWYEVHKKHFKIHLTPLSIAPHFQEVLGQQKRAWVFTSATLTVNNQFTHYLQNLGLQQLKTLKLDSPFDYSQQALLYIPEHLPDPQDENYVAAVVKAAIPVINASQGRSFFLFTSHRALQQAAQLLMSQIDYPLFIQGSQPKRALLNAFCQTENAVLLGTSSFWEGVDIRGEALSCVIIDKLPFAAVEDPVMKARLTHLKKQGKDPFVDYQLPLAVIALKQGVGRLIRDYTDSGVLMLCDPRLMSKNYGEVFLRSIPPAKLTRQLIDVQNFFTERG